MAWQHTIYAYPIVFATAVSIVLAAYAISHSRQYGRTPTLVVFAAMNVGVALWTGFSAIKLLSTDPVIQLQMYRLLNVGSQSIAPLLFLFALAYTDRTRWLRPRVVAGIFVVPVVYLVLLFTNPYNMVIVDTYVVTVDGLLVMRTETGPAYVTMSFTYVLTLAVLTLGIILYEAFRLGRSYLPQATLMGIAIVTPMTASFLTSAGIPPFSHDGINFVPASAAVSLLALGIATFRYQLLDLPPIAYTTAMKRSPDGVLVLDSTERIVHANDAAYPLLGLSESVLGRSVEMALPEFDLQSAEDEPIDISPADGQAGILNVRSQSFNRHGERLGTVLVLRDVTERRRRERELEAFTGMVSHDLREPIRTIENYLRLLEQQGESMDESDRELVLVARENAERMQAMIADLLRYSRIGATDEEVRAIDGEQLLSAVLDDLRFEIEDRDATVTVEGSVPTIQGVEHLLRSLFQNLLVNALKHSGDTPTIHVPVNETDDGWQFSVRDDGVGIEPEELDRIFDIFTIGSNTDPDSGTGMGLAICKRIVEEHEGTIDIESTPGAGTEVIVTIPRDRG